MASGSSGVSQDAELLWTLKGEAHIGAEYPLGTLLWCAGTVISLVYVCPVFLHGPLSNGHQQRGLSANTVVDRLQRDVCSSGNLFGRDCGDAPSIRSSSAISIRFRRISAARRWVRVRVGVFMEVDFTTSHD